MPKPLDIFLFNGCDSSLCKQSYNALLKRSKKLSIVFSKNEPRLNGSEVNTIVADGREIRGLNKRFRNQDRATDVLAFPMDDLLLGEIWLCPSVIRKNAKKYGRPFEEELIRVLVHGILHLLEYDHKESFRGESSLKEEMFRRQESLVTAVFN